MALKVFCYIFFRNLRTIKYENKSKLLEHRTPTVHFCRSGFLRLVCKVQFISNTDKGRSKLCKVESIENSLL